MAWHTKRTQTEKGWVREAGAPPGTLTGHTVAPEAYRRTGAGYLADCRRTFWQHLDRLPQA
jgi:hypothetical protein